MKTAKKNKFAYVLLLVLILPLTLLFGCGETASYSVQAYLSCTAGTTTGSGTYSEGSTVTLTATAKSGSFLGWVRDDTLLSSGSTFKISNTTSSSDASYITKSVLTFTASATTQGNYTAVFDDSKVMYAQLHSVEFSGSLELTQFTLAEGSNVITTVVSAADLASIETEVSANNSVIKLSTTEAKFVKLNFFASTTGSTSTQITLQAALNFQTSTPLKTDENGNTVDEDQDGQADFDEISTTNGTYHVVYADGVYEIVFTFSIGTEEHQVSVKYLTLGTTIEEEI